MATSQMSDVLQNLRRVLLQREGAELSDGQLLEDYISRQDEAALAVFEQGGAGGVTGKLPSLRLLQRIKLPKRETHMILNLQQSRRAGTVENGEPVPMNVAGTECVLVRTDIFLRMDRNLESGRRAVLPTHSANGTSEKTVPQEPSDDFDPEPPPWLEVENDVYFPMTVPSYSLGKVKLKVEKGKPCIILPEELPDE